MRLPQCEPRRVALVGPTAKHGGGIADHTVELASRLAAAGLLVEHAGWGRLFPVRFVPNAVSKREIRAFREEKARATGAIDHSRTNELHWDRPASWVRTGSRLAAAADELHLVVSSPLQLPAIQAITSAFRRHARTQPRVALIIHNVVPHESRPWDRRLMRKILRLADRVVTHSGPEADTARLLGAKHVVRTVLPLHPPHGIRPSEHPAGDTQLRRLGFFGLVREYKGGSNLIEAVSRTRNVSLVVQGEFWEPVEKYAVQIREIGLSARVELRPGFAPPEIIAKFFSEVDAVVLPYLSSTATQQPRLAFLRGVPVIVTDVGDLAEQVRHEVDGLIVSEPSPDALASAIQHFYTGDTSLRLRRGVRRPDVDSEWDAYLAALLG